MTESTAYRLAGQAICAHGCGLPILDVDATGNGCVRLDLPDPAYHRPLCGTLHDDPVRTCRRLLLVAVAGGVAESIMGERYGSPSRRVSDVIQAKGWRWISDHAGDAHDAGAHGYSLAGWAGVPSHDVIPFVEYVILRAERMAEALLRKRWQHVAALGEVLLRRGGRLDGVEVGRLLRGPGG